MSLVRRVVVPVAGNAQVIPPDGKDHAGEWEWTVINPVGSGGAVELVDDPTKALGQGDPLAAGAVPFQVLGRGTNLWALGPASGAPVTVIIEGEVVSD